MKNPLFISMAETTDQAIQHLGQRTAEIQAGMFFFGFAILVGSIVGLILLYRILRKL